MDTTDQRLCSRINLTRAVKITLDDGTIINATTDDISLGGIKVFSIHELSDCSGQTAKLQLMISDNKYSDDFTCEIVSCESTILRLKLERKQATQFGRLVSKGALKKVNQT